MHAESAELMSGSADVRFGVGRDLLTVSFLRVPSKVHVFADKLLIEPLFGKPTEIDFDKVDKVEVVEATSRSSIFLVRMKPTLRCFSVRMKKDGDTDMSALNSFLLQNKAFESEMVGDKYVFAVAMLVVGILAIAQAAIFGAINI